MITLDPEFLGKLTSPGKMTEGIDPDTIPFARRPRLERLRVQGKADVTEDVNEADEMTDDPADATVARARDYAERERRKMRGKGKSLKR
jgi:U3 small nucleolar RNA-associated protein 7